MDLSGLTRSMPVEQTRAGCRGRVTKAMARTTVAALLAAVLASCSTGGGGEADTPTTTTTQGRPTTTIDLGTPDTCPDTCEVASERARSVDVSLSDLRDADGWAEMTAPDPLSRDCDPSFLPEDAAGEVATSFNPLLYQGSEDNNTASIAVTTTVWESEAVAGKALAAMQDPEVLQCMEDVITDTLAGNKAYEVEASVRDISGPGAPVDPEIDETTVATTTASISKDAKPYLEDRGMIVVYREGNMTVKVSWRTMDPRFDFAPFSDVTRHVQEDLLAA